MSDDLAKFLAARLDDDEVFARTMTEVGQRQAAAATPDDIADACGMAFSVLSDPQVWPLIERYVDGVMLPPNNLERVMRNVEAIRAILARYTEARSWSYPPGDGDEAVQEALYLVVCNLAATWSDHPDYRDEWKP